MNSIFYEDAMRHDPESTNNSHLGEIDKEQVKNKYMYIDLTITEEKKIQKEILLPYFAEDICNFYMVANDKKIIILRKSGSLLGQCIEMLYPKSVCYDTSGLARAASGEEVSEETFMKAYYEVMGKFDVAVFPSVIEAITEEKTA